jgi:hypothetical protein
MSTGFVAEDSARRGDVQTALNGYLAAGEMFRRLAQDLGDGQAQEDFAINLANIAHCKQILGDIPAAMAESRKAIQILEHIVAASPDYQHAREELNMTRSFAANLAKLGSIAQPATRTTTPKAPATSTSTRSALPP